jgi:drug/metabolite transporter (DMT)-like permease
LADPASMPATNELSSRQGILGVLYAMGFSFFLGWGWVLVKHMSTEMHALEVTFWGAFFGFLAFIPTILKNGMKVLGTKRIGTHFIRACANSCAILAWFWGLTMVDLADAAALNMLAPLFITIGAMFFFGEQVGPKRWAALIVGGLGAIVVVRPGFQEMNIGIAMVTTTAIFSAIQRLISKSLSGTESSTTSVIYLMFFMIPVTLLAASFVWTWPTWEQLGVLAVLGMLLSAGHFSWMKALTYADISAVEPVNFTRILFAAVLGFYFFNEVPTIFTWIGGIMIVGSTTYIARREAAIRSGRIPAEAG